MTTVLPSRQTSGEKELAGAQSTGHADGGAADAPVIVLTYKHGGSDRLWSLLTGHPGLVCTIGTGLLPLCEQAAATWRYVDGRKDTPMPALAANSIRAMATAVITTVLARHGGRRWCEFSTAPRSTDAFLQLYPQTRVLCLHRSCVAVIQDAVRAHPWGLAGPEYAPFTAAYPASTPAALTAYWTAATTSLVEFEGAHPEASIRVRYEDLADDFDPAELLAFLGIEGPRSGNCGPDLPFRDSPPSEPASHARFPADDVPAPLLAQADRLNRELGYPCLTLGPTP